MHTFDDVDDDLVQYLPRLQHKQKKVEKVPGQNLYSVYGFSNHINSLIDQLWETKKVKMYSFTSLLSLYYIGRSKALMHVHVEESKIYIYIQQDGKLLLYNSFDIKGFNDILYFMLATCGETQINAATDEVSVS